MPDSNVAFIINEALNDLSVAIDDLAMYTEDTEYDYHNIERFNARLLELRDLATRFQEGMRGAELYEQIAQEAHPRGQEAGPLAVDVAPPIPGAPVASPRAELVASDEHAYTERTLSDIMHAITEFGPSETDLARAVRRLEQSLASGQPTTEWQIPAEGSDAQTEF